MKEKLAIVLSGGGARGSYQAGAIRAIYEIIKKDQNLFDIITGNSVGAVNAIFLANNARDWGDSTQFLLEFWKRIKTEDVFDINNLMMGKMGAKWMRENIFGDTSNIVSKNGILNTEPLKNLISREVDFMEIHNLIKEKFIDSVALTTTNYYSGSTVVYFDGDKNIHDWSKSDKLSIRTQLNIAHVMGSSAIPIFFPPVKIDNSYYGDGCIRQTTPLSPAIHLGATKLITIGIRHKQPLEAIKELISHTNQPPEFSQIGSVVINAIFLDSLDSDVERLEKMNIMVEIMGKNSPWRNIPIISLIPSRDLGSMTSKLNKEIPKLLRFFLNSIGVCGESGLNLLSFFAFDASYTTEVAELGYEDTMMRKSEIQNFIDS